MVSTVINQVLAGIEFWLHLAYFKENRRCLANNISKNGAVQTQMTLNINRY
jgi:hypothetical protein